MLNTWLSVAIYLILKGCDCARTLSTRPKWVKSRELYHLSLGDFEPWSIASAGEERQAKHDQRNWPMMTFQLLGMGFMALFFGALITGNPGTVSRD